MTDRVQADDVCGKNRSARAGETRPFGKQAGGGSKEEKRTFRITRAVEKRHFHPYRTTACGALRKEEAGETVRLSGWVHRLRGHGGLPFIDPRGHYGLTQCVTNPSEPAFAATE
jgi:hypothetical protein